MTNYEGECRMQRMNPSDNLTNNGQSRARKQADPPYSDSPPTSPTESIHK
jgi:hypothetical protein